MYVWFNTDCTHSCVLYRFMLVSTVLSSYLVMDLSKLVERWLYTFTHSVLLCICKNWECTYMSCVFLEIETLVLQYTCTFWPLQGSYGRLGLGNSENQPNLRSVGTFPDHPLIRNIVSSKGSDGHSLAITADGQALSWGDGECSFGYVYCYCKACFFIILAVNLTCTCQHLSVTSVFHCCLYSGNYGKLGHGDIATQKTPKIISALTGKVRTVSMLLCTITHYTYMYSHLCFYRWWCLWRVAIDTVLQWPWRESSTHGERVNTADWVSHGEDSGLIYGHWNWKM